MMFPALGARGGGKYLIRREPGPRGGGLVNGLAGKGGMRKKVSAGKNVCLSEDLDE